MDDKTHDFNRLRPRLQAIAYRMLGTVADAEELVQDVWLRWHEADTEELDSAEAWLVTVVTRLAIDRLRTAKVQREHYTGFWLPEPQLTADDGPASPEELLERADDISMAFLALLERLAPEARAAFLLREVFDADYADVAQTLGKSEAACRQIVSRAKAQLKDGRVRQAVSPDTHYKLLSGFAEAARRGDFTALQALLAEDAELISDGGGKVPSFGKVLLGAARIAQLYLALWLRASKGELSLRMELVQLNGQWGLLRFIDGQLESAQSFESDGERITRVHTQRNPDKLRRIAQAWAVTKAGSNAS
ncbi:RNA polymerase sigma-70 factor [Hylemonella gracilis]|jgi:RNA polymerase sigma-70 factor (ECF subfamily)|uniref:RNA polymerase sigma-70 factor n=1 Tax=Hylemonella gracilis TaxID=80880 RepID=A0A4P6UHQ1_9BURK|nr:RNA polymerase sigma-70 factor [Hylemonella gracilis]QBK03844.1 RNA polymerase sigma-70 factor [Hylemonella gracilis]